MDGLRFVVEPPVLPADPHRTDIACFVGFVARRRREGVAVPLSPAMLRALRELQLVGRDAPATVSLLHRPVPIDTWDAFDRLFAWEARPVDRSGRTQDSYLGAAVRSFFAQGGRKCYVVQAGEPLPYLSDAAAVATIADGARREAILRALRMAPVAQLVPGWRLPGELAAALSGLDADALGVPGPLDPVSASDRSSWRGAAAVLAAAESSFLCLPDLADVFGIEPQVLAQAAPEPPAEQFVECSTRETEPVTRARARPLRAPRCDALGYREWARALRLLRDLVARLQREVQLVAAVPIAAEGIGLAPDLLPRLDADGLGSAFVQLAYPWVRSRDSGRLPQALESPDAVLVGVLARNALARGAFRSAAGLELIGAIDTQPALSGAERRLPERSGDTDAGPLRLVERVSLLGRVATGMQVLSDVTTSADPAWRPAGVNRLVALLLRAARRLGDQILFEPNGEALWAKLADRLGGLLTALWQEGALEGKRPQEAFRIRCDRSTMSQYDIDNGRLVAQIEFRAAAGIALIAVVLSMNEGGRVSLAPVETAEAAP